MPNQKYEITDIAHEQYPFLHRIRALRDELYPHRPAAQKDKTRRKEMER